MKFSTLSCNRTEIRYPQWTLEQLQGKSHHSASRSWVLEHALQQQPNRGPGLNCSLDHVAIARTSNMEEPSGKALRQTGGSLGVMVAPNQLWSTPSLRPSKYRDDLGLLLLGAFGLGGCLYKYVISQLR